MNLERRSTAASLLAAALLLTAFAAAAEQDFSKISARPAPAWLRDGVVYEIFTRNFSASGKFTAITARLDELKDLGVDILWLMPIHPIGETARKGPIGSPYAIKDYYAIDPAHGTPADFKQLVAAAHQRGMKVIMDIVANHTAWDSVMMAHPEFYKQDDKGKVIPPVPSWTDVAGLNYESPALRAYMIAMLKHWLADFDVDGFRCDVAYMVPTSFWEEARAALTKLKPDIMLLAEASKPELLTNAFDIDYAWPLHGTLNEVLLNGKPATELRRSWEESLRQFPQGSLHLRISDNHDEARAVARFSIRGALAAEVLMLTLDGVPLLYNGMEVGDATESGDPALFEKMPVYWSPKDRPPLRAIYRDLIKLRKAHPALRSGEVVWVKNSDEKNVVSFERRDGTEEFLIVINFSNRPCDVRVDGRDSRTFTPVQLMGTRADGQLPNIQLHGFEWRIYRRDTAK